MENWAREYVRRRVERDPEFRSAWEKGAPAVTVAKALRQLRSDLGVTQRRLAELTRMPQPQIARMERAKGASLRSLFRLAFALGLDVELRFVPVEPAEVEPDLDQATDIARVRLDHEALAPSRRLRLDSPVLRIEPDGRLDISA